MSVRDITSDTAGPVPDGKGVRIITTNSNGIRRSISAVFFKVLSTILVSVSVPGDNDEKDGVSIDARSQVVSVEVASLRPESVIADSERNLDNLQGASRMLL